MDLVGRLEPLSRPFWSWCWPLEPTSFWTPSKLEERMGIGRISNPELRSWVTCHSELHCGRSFSYPNFANLRVESNTTARLRHRQNGKKVFWLDNLMAQKGIWKRVTNCTSHTSPTMWKPGLCGDQAWCRDCRGLRRKHATAIHSPSGQPLWRLILV